MKQAYKSIRFSPEKRRLIAICESILKEYIEAGYRITVRTLYYQLVSRDVIPNQEKSYKNLTNLVNDARMAGLLDWDVIEDRGRRPVVRPRWGTGKDFLMSVAPQYHTDHWDAQPDRVFVVVEKDALAGVLEDTCHEFDVPLLAAKGYPSVSSVRDLVRHQIFPYMQEQEVHEGKIRRSWKTFDKRQRIVFLHMGDHDPSGIDMSRDLEERLNIFNEGVFELEFRRIALNMEQIEEREPPPNPAKVTDSRFANYQAEFGDESWELDALPPDYLNGLLRENIEQHVDQELWDARAEHIKDTRERLVQLANAF